MASGHGGNAETLRRYWAEGEGAAKIRWGKPGDWARCVAEVDKYMPGRAKGYCNLLHHRALGYYPATHAKMAASHGADLVEAAVALGIATPDALKSRAGHGTRTSHDRSDAVTLALAGTFNAALHPKAPAGSPAGGQFTAGTARNSQAAADQKAPGAADAYNKAIGAKDADAQIAGMENDKLGALMKAAYSFKSSDPKVVALRLKLAAEVKRRGGNPADYGALNGKPTPGGPKPLKGGPKPAAKAPAKKAAAAKKAPAARKPAARKAAAKKPVTAKPAAPKASAAATRAAANGAAPQTGGRPARIGAANAHPAHGLALAVPMASSQDGPQVTMNDALKTPHDIRRAVIAHGKVPPTLRPAYRKTVKKAAKRIGAMAHVPSAWMAS